MSVCVLSANISQEICVKTSPNLLRMLAPAVTWFSFVAVLQYVIYFQLCRVGFFSRTFSIPLVCKIVQRNNRNRKTNLKPNPTDVQLNPILLTLTLFEHLAKNFHCFVNDVIFPYDGTGNTSRM